MCIFIYAHSGSAGPRLPARDRGDRATQKLVSRAQNFSWCALRCLPSSCYCCSTVITARPRFPDFEAFKTGLAAPLDFVQLAFRRCSFTHFSGRETIYVSIVNKVTDDSAKLATKLTSQQVAFFRTMVRCLLAPSGRHVLCLLVNC